MFGPNHLKMNKQPTIVAVLFLCVSVLMACCGVNVIYVSLMIHCWLFSTGFSLCAALPTWQVRHQLQQGLCLSQRWTVRPRRGAVPLCSGLQWTQVHSRQTAKLWYAKASLSGFLIKRLFSCYFKNRSDNGKICLHQYWVQRGSVILTVKKNIYLNL